MYSIKEKNNPKREKINYGKGISACFFIFMLIFCQFLYKKYDFDYSYILNVIGHHGISAPIFFILIYSIFVILLFPKLRSLDILIGRPISILPFPVKVMIFMPEDCALTKL